MCPLRGRDASLREMMCGYRRVMFRPLGEVNAIESETNRGRRMNKAIIFDLDGTLWDATGCSVDIWNRVFDKHKEVSIRMTQEISSSLMGKTMPEIGAALFPEMTEEARMNIVDDFGEEEVRYLFEHGAILYDSVEETLSALEQDYDLYIVSNCQDGYVPAFLHAHKLERHFKDIEMSGRTGMDKGRNIQLIMERNGIGDAVYVGDTEGDETAARFAGIPFVWAAYGFGRAKAPDKTIHSIKELMCVREYPNDV